MKRSCWLSIDYDFFVRSLMEWDWSHKEAPFFRSGFIWQTRVAPFLMQGIDLRHEMDPGVHGHPKPDSFWNLLSQLGYDFDEYLPFVVDDSHAGAGPFFNHIAEMDLDEPADVIVNFDAHHDLGYCEWERLHGMVEQEVCTCDMWLGALLSWWPTLQARIVFPDWMKDEWTIEEQAENVQKKLPRKILSRVKMGFFTAENGTVSPIVIEPRERLSVTAIFVCRSGAWVPPWLDEDFIEFVENGEQEVGSVATEPFADSNVSALEPREDFDMGAAKLMAEQWKAVMTEGVEVATKMIRDDND